MTVRRLVFTAGIAAIALVALAGGAFWYLVLRDDAPPPVSLADAVQGVAATPTTAPTTGGATAAPEPTSTPVPLDDLAGEWAVAASPETFAGYRVKEELASVGFTTAVGRTADVSGTFLVSEDTVQSGSIEANLAALRSDRGFRDNALRTQALQTNRFPTATFVLTAPVDIPPGLLAAEAVSLTLSGELTLHGVTRPVDIPVQAQVVGSRLVVVGSIEIVFADYEIAQPRAQSVLSVEDRGVMEFQLVFAKP